MANSKVSLASKVENAVGNHEITDTCMWKIHFSDLLNTVHYTDSKGFVSNHIDAVDSESHITITASGVPNCLKETKLGKSAGIDGLAARHFIHSHVSIIVHLSLLFSCLLSHGFLLDVFLRTSIIPILKNENGDTSAKSNYRQIAIVTPMSKIFELCLSRIMDVYLFTSDNQFGFKQKHSTVLSIYTMKSIIQYYNYHSSPVYIVFLMHRKPLIE